MLISTSTPAHNQRDFPSTDAANNVSGFSPLLLSLLSPSPFPFFSPLRFSGGAPQMSTHKHSAGISASAQCRPQSWSGAAQGNPLEGQNQPEYPPHPPPPRDFTLEVVGGKMLRALQRGCREWIQQGCGQHLCPCPDVTGVQSRRQGSPLVQGTSSPFSAPPQSDLG